ncbi:MAG: hypothetical protein RL685_4887 [Pseudomonadota bacterium]
MATACSIGGSSDNSAAAPPVTPELARAIADGWTEQALMEHASVAAFARFVLQLLSLGAPAELVSDATGAMQDEIRHARDCFRLARRHLPADIGPGPLPVHGALAESSLREIVLSTVREGCIGETVAALEATEALAHCEDAEARAVLERIAVEEGQHAQLAWRFVAWALETAPHTERAGLLASIEAVFTAELEATSPAPPASERERQLAEHGLLSTGLRRALRQRALAEVVAPCAQALLATAHAQSANRSSMPSTAQARRVAGRAAT